MVSIAGTQHSLLIHSSVPGHLDCFHDLAYCGDERFYIVSFEDTGLHFFGIKEWDCWVREQVYFNFMENYQTVCQGGRAIFHSLPRCVGIPVALHPQQAPLWSLFHSLRCLTIFMNLLFYFWVERVLYMLWTEFLCQKYVLEVFSVKLFLKIPFVHHSFCFNFYAV